MSCGEVETEALFFVEFITYAHFIPDLKYSAVLTQP
jgi:hypothetical protein